MYLRQVRLLLLRAVVLLLVLGLLQLGCARPTLLEFRLGGQVLPVHVLLCVLLADLTVCRAGASARASSRAVAQAAARAASQAAQASRAVAAAAPAEHEYTAKVPHSRCLFGSRRISSIIHSAYSRAQSQLSRWHRAQAKQPAARHSTAHRHEQQQVRAACISSSRITCGMSWYSKVRSAPQRPQGGTSAAFSRPSRCVHSGVPPR